MTPRVLLCFYSCLVHFGTTEWGWNRRWCSCSKEGDQKCKCKKTRQKETFRHFQLPRALQASLQLDLRLHIDCNLWNQSHHSQHRSTFNPQMNDVPFNKLNSSSLPPWKNSRIDSGCCTKQFHVRLLPVFTGNWQNPLLSWGRFELCRPFDWQIPKVRMWSKLPGNMVNTCRGCLWKGIG